MQTFTKDIILLVLSLLLLLQRKHITAWFKPAVSGIIVLAGLAGTLFLQWYVLRYLPVKDCLPYKTGNNILELRKMPADAVPDKFAMSFVYEKNGEKKEFTAENLPDSSWNFVDRKQTLIAAGKNNVPPISDFNLITAGGTDTTEALLSNPGIYYILFIKDIQRFDKNFKADLALRDAAKNTGTPFVIVTAQKEKVLERFGNDATVLTCDATALKTAARADAVLYKMKGPVVQQKWGWASFGNVSISK